VQGIIPAYGVGSGLLMVVTWFKPEMAVKNRAGLYLIMNKED